MTITKITRKYSQPYWSMHTKIILMFCLIVRILHIKFWRIPCNASWDLCVPNILEKSENTTSSNEQYAPKSIQNRFMSRLNWMLNFLKLKLKISFISFNFLNFLKKRKFFSFWTRAQTEGYVFQKQNKHYLEQKVKTFRYSNSFFFF